MLSKSSEMLALTLFVVIICPVLSNTLGLSYNLNEGFINKFDKKYCENNSSEWYEVDYSSVGVSDPNGSERGILASSNSCVTSPPIRLDVGSTLEVYVYLSVFSKESGVYVILTEEDSAKELARYVYSNSINNILPGWARIRIPIELNSVVRISLLGYSLRNEIIIVDHIKYSPQSNVADGNVDFVPVRGKRIIDSIDSHHHMREKDGQGNKNTGSGIEDYNYITKHMLVNKNSDNNNNIVIDKRRHRGENDNQVTLKGNNDESTAGDGSDGIEPILQEPENNENDTPVPENGGGGSENDTSPPENGGEGNENDTPVPENGGGGSENDTLPPGNGAGGSETDTPETEDGAGGSETDTPDPENGAGGSETDTTEPEDGAGGSETDTPEPEDGAGGSETDTPEGGESGEISTPDPGGDGQTDSEEDKPESGLNISLSWLLVGLIGGGIVAGVVAVAIFCYFLGQSSSGAPMIDPTDIEPPRTVIIPRVKEASKMSTISRYD